MRLHRPLPYRTIPYHTIPYRTMPYHTISYHTILYHTMGVLPSTQPVATLGSSFILSSFDVACTCCVPYVRTIPYHTMGVLPSTQPYHTMGVLLSTQPYHTIPTLNLFWIRRVLHPAPAKQAGIQNISQITIFGAIFVKRGAMLYNVFVY